jgi:hypothetical protein
MQDGRGERLHPHKGKAAHSAASLVSALLLRQSNEQSRNGARPFRNHARHLFTGFSDGAFLASVTVMYGRGHVSGDI